MEIVSALTVGVLFAAGLYLVQGRNAFRLLIGIVILAHAVNLLVFTSGGLVRGAPPILPEEGAGSGEVADPLSQALILTAIVIGLGVQSFVLVLIYRLVQVARTRDLDRLRTTEEAGE